MKNFMEQNLETVDKHKMTIDELLFLQNLQEIYRKQKLLVMVMMQSLLTMFLKNR